MKEKNFFKNWYIQHKNYVIRPYADRILNHDLPKAFANEYTEDLSGVKMSEPVVLAASPNAGKTLMAVAWIEKYILDNPCSRVLVLAHGQNILKDQFASEITKANVNFSYTKVQNITDFTDTEAQVVVAIPQTIYKYVADDNKRFDLLIVDEAHQYYFETMVQRIIDIYKPKHQLLLTGTPAPFIDRKYKNIIPVCLEELIDGGFSADPIVVVASSDYNITEDDFNAENELKENVKLDTSATISTMNNLLVKIEEKIAKKGWVDTVDTIGKTMIVTKNIQQARDIKNYFKDNGVDCLISNSKDDITSDEINHFIHSGINILVVVNRGILGFNLPTLVNIIDMKCGKNVSNLFQLINRVTRIHPDGTQKYFFKLVPVTLEVDYLYQISTALSLMKMENYMKYNGHNELDMVIQKKKKRVVEEDETTGGKVNHKSAKMWCFEPVEYIDIPVSKMWKMHTDFSWNTLRSIKETMSASRSWSSYTKEENYQFCLQTIKDYYGL